MKTRLVKIALTIVGGLVIFVTGLLIYTKTALPNVGPAPVVKIASSAEQIERGKYLANNVAACMDCHSTRDWKKYAGPLIPGTLGSGGEEFNQQLGFPGQYFAPNLTPSHLGSWTDGEIYRAITSGVSKDGRALFPVMPHPRYGQVSKEDIYAIISYLRTLEPIQKEVKASASDFPMNFIINTIPQKATHNLVADKNNGVVYGQYLVTMAACAECHTKQDKGAPVEGMDFAGGFEFKFPDGSMSRSANITPDENTGIGRWSKEAFINRFKAYKDAASAQPLASGQVNTVMPWFMYSGMSDEDLGAIYDYLKTVKPIDNKVEKFVAAVK